MPRWEPIGEDDAVYTLVQFEGMVRTRCFIDYDGFGELAREGQKDTQMRVYPSRFDRAMARRAGYTHVVWYNR